MLMTPPGVDAPQHDTWLLTEALHRENITEDTAVLDIGTGSGALAIAAARAGAGQVTAVDVSPLAVATAWLHARLEGLRINVMRGDLLTSVADRHFDLIIANPPYVPSPDVRRGRAVAWNAGVDGRALVDQICQDAPLLLHPGGVLLLVHSALCGIEATVERLGRVGLGAAATDGRLIPFGPVLCGQAAWLEPPRSVSPLARPWSMPPPRLPQASTTSCPCAARGRARPPGDEPSRFDHRVESMGTVRRAGGYGDHVGHEEGGGRPQAAAPGLSQGIGGRTRPQLAPPGVTSSPATVLTSHLCSGSGCVGPKKRLKPVMCSSGQAPDTRLNRHGPW